MTLSVSQLKSIFQNPNIYSHPVNQPIEMIETHISLIVLTGTFAYKIKKSLSLDFLDFTTLASRHHFCREELRLNQRTASGLYIDLVALSKHLGGYALVPGEEAHEPLEVAVRMKQFSPGSLFSEMIRDSSLQPEHAKELGKVVAEFHKNCISCESDSKFGTVEEIHSDILDNVDEMHRHCRKLAEASSYKRVRALSEDFLSAKKSILLSRREHHMIRECHGDLHLGNIAVYEGRPVPFDCIEFKDNFRWIDTAADYAFTFMDFLAHNAFHYASFFLHEYLEVSGDYDGVALLPLYMSRQAAVRAKVLSMAAEAESLEDLQDIQMKRARAYFLLALNSLELPRGLILVVCGLSGSGKSTLAQLLSHTIQGIQLRSDVLRKHLLGITRYEPAGSEGYTQTITESVYATLAKNAVLLAESGWTVLTDATFCSQSSREAFSHYCRSRKFDPIYIHCQAPYHVLVERIEKRRGDVSDATTTVLEQQRFDPFDKLTDKVITLDSTLPAQCLVDEVQQTLQLHRRFNVQ